MVRTAWRNDLVLLDWTDYQTTGSLADNRKHLFPIMTWGYPSSGATPRGAGPGRRSGRGARPSWPAVETLDVPSYYRVPKPFVLNMMCVAWEKA